MRKRAALVTGVRVSGLILLGVVGGVVGALAATPTTTSSTANSKKLGYSELSNGRGGTNVEAFVVPDGFDKARSLAAFKDTLYPVLRANCSGCQLSARKTNWEVERRLRCTRMST